MSVATIEALLTPRLADFSALDATVKFDFGDDRLFIDGTHTPATLSHDDSDADCTLVASPDTFLAIVNGKQDATLAVMTGKLKVKGSTGIALKLASVLKD